MRRIRTSFAALLLLATVTHAAAMPAPAPDALAAWQATCDSSGRVRVVTRAREFHSDRVALDSAGVRLLGPSGRAALFVIGEPQPDERRLAWADVERIDRAAGTSAGRGLITGAIIGGVTGGALVASFGPDIAESGDHGVAGLAVLLGVTTSLIGFLLGAATTHWVPIAP